MTLLWEGDVCNITVKMSHQPPPRYFRQHCPVALFAGDLSPSDRVISLFRQTLCLLLRWDFLVASFWTVLQVLRQIFSRGFVSVSSACMV